MQTSTGDIFSQVVATKPQFAKRTTASQQAVSFGHRGPSEAAQSGPREALQGNAINGELEPLKRRVQLPCSTSAWK